MSDVPVTGLDLDAAAKRINEAHEWVGDLCTGKRQWRMRVPVDASDSDVTISQALNYGEQAVAALRRVLAACDDAELMICADEDPAEPVAPPIVCVAVVDIRAAVGAVGGQE